MGVPSYNGQLVATGTHHNEVAASQTNQALVNPNKPLTVGAAGDFLSHLLIVPASLSPGAVTISDGDGAAITVFAGGASSLLTLTPFPVPVGALSVKGPWKVTTGASVSVMAMGLFS